MSIQVFWDNEEKTILRYALRDKWNLDDVNIAITEGNALAESVDHKVHGIVDLQDSDFVPKNLVTHFRGSRTQIHSNAGMFVLVGGSPILQTVFNVYRRIYPSNDENFAFASTIEEAHAIITQKG